MLSWTLAGELNTDAVTAAVLSVDPVDAEDTDIREKGGEDVSDDREQVSSQTLPVVFLLRINSWKLGV